MNGRTQSTYRIGRQSLLELPMLKALPLLAAALAIFLNLVLVAPAHGAQTDPFENVNRVTHQLNRTVDRFLFKPLAKTYRKVLPGAVRTGVRNVFSNLDDVKVTVNDLFQLDFEAAASDFGRFAVNSTAGLGGLIDVAEPVLGLEKNRQDFGKTLAHYGFESGPYVVLPLLGPSTVRDAFGLSVDSIVEPVRQVDHAPTRNSLLALEAIDFRARVLSFDDLITGDDYLFIREAYLQQREFATGDDLFVVAFE